MDGASVCLFDPYFRKKPYKQGGIEIVQNEPEKWNRKVAVALMDSTACNPYALGAIEGREAVLLFNERTRRGPQETIEYFI
jgi:hypothetical protein